MTTTTTVIGADELRAQITAHEATLAEAEREIGVATLEGRATTAATKRAGAARDAIRHLRSALDESRPHRSGAGPVDLCVGDAPG